MSAEADDKTTSKSDDSLLEEKSTQKYTEEEHKDILKLRKENERRRLENKEIISVNAQLELEKLKNQELLKTLNEEKEKLKADVAKYSSYEKRLVETEIKAQAVLEGIKDVDLIKMIDLSNIKVSEGGEVDISAITEAVKSLKEKKPFLFGSERITSTSSNASTSKKTTTGTFDALKASPEEVEREWRSLKNRK